MIQTVSTKLIHTTRSNLKSWAEKLAAEQTKNYSGTFIRTNLHNSCSGFISYVDAGAEVWLKLTHTQCMQKSRSPYLQQKAQIALENWKDLSRSELAEAKKETFVILKLSAWVDTNNDLLEFRGYYCFDEYGRDSILWLKYMGGNPNQTSLTTNDFYSSISLSEYNEKGTIMDGYIQKGSVESWLELETIKTFRHLNRM